MRITKGQLRSIIREMIDKGAARPSHKNLKIAFDEVESPDGRLYYVSTANRTSSALAAYGEPYAETLVFSRNDDDTVGGRPSVVWQGSAWEGSRKTHDKAVEILQDKGLEALQDEMY